METIIQLWGTEGKAHILCDLENHVLESKHMGSYQGHLLSLSW